MSATTSERATVEVPPRPAPAPRSIAVGVVGLAMLAFAIWSVIDLDINLATLATSVDNAVNFAGRIFPLDFPPLGETVAMVGYTLSIVYLATVLAVLLSIPVAIGAAQVTARSPFGRSANRVLIVLMRAIPDVILAIAFFRMFGLGALPGILALALHSIGMIGKLYADAMESLDHGPYHALAAAGASRWQAIAPGILQPLLPQIIATALHRFDINLRTSVVLGYVGVGGLGLEISNAMRTLNYPRGMALAVIVLVLCIAMELLSGSIRAAIMNEGSRSWAQRMWDSIGRPSEHQGIDTSRLEPPWSGERMSRFGSWAIVLGLVVIAWIVAGVDLGSFFAGLLNLPATLALFLPPDTSVLDSILEELLVTVQIGFAATFLGAILAVPIGILAARNVTASRIVNQTFRVIIVVVRGIPELILAIVFVVISGLGPIAGTLALAVGAVGLLSKLLADSIEETDTDVQRALTANGATRLQVFVSATLRQSLPAFVAHTLYLLDTNIRSATLLGIVGAGGVGFLLLNASRVQQFGVVTTILLLILAVVVLVEALSIWMRSAVE